MKIVLYTMEYPPQKGGVANYYAGLIKAMGKSREVAVKVLPATSRWWNVMINIILHKANIVWVGQILPIGTVAWICHKIFKTKYIVSLHGMDINLAQQNKSNLTARILKGAGLITVNSEYTKKQINNYLDLESKIEIVYPCPNIDYVHDEELVARVKQAYGLAEKRILLSVGRLVERKGMQNVIQLMPELILKYPNLIYIIIGAGDNLPELQRLIQTKKLEEHVKVLTGVGNQELTAFYYLADIFIMPTIDDGIDVEGFGIVYLEAGVYAKPVIATPVGGASEAVIDNETGLLVEKNNLSVAIEKLLEDHGLATKFGANAQQLIKSKYSYTIQVKKILQRL